MSTNNVKVALIYDFDGTLSTTYMQDYELIPAFGYEPKDFWKKANKWARDNIADQITGTMYYIKRVAAEKGVELTKKSLNNIGKSIKYYEGVLEWFLQINAYGKEVGLDIEHYIISAGLEEIIEGSEIRKYFKDVFACSFAYDCDEHPIWPARVVNYTTKTQYLSKISKGLGKADDEEVNKVFPYHQRPIPYARMIYLGDGMTDIPSMRLVKEKGGNSIAVYKPKSKREKNVAIGLLSDNRVDFALPADYRENKEIDKVVKTILQKIATERDLEVLKAKEEKKKITKKIKKTLALIKKLS